MKRTGLKFEWKSSSKNENAIKVLKENKIDWYYDHFFNLRADFYRVGLYQKICYECIRNDIYEICVEED